MGDIRMAAISPSVPAQTMCVAEVQGERRPEDNSGESTNGKLGRGSNGKVRRGGQVSNGKVRSGGLNQVRQALDGGSPTIPGIARGRPTALDGGEAELILLKLNFVPGPDPSLVDPERHLLPQSRPLP